MLQLTKNQGSVLFQNRKSLPHFPILSRGLLLSTIINALTRALHSVSKREKDIRCCQLKFLQCSQAKQIVFLNFLLFTFFLVIFIIYLFIAIGFAPGDSTPTLVQTKMIKQHYTVVQHNTTKRKHHNTIKRKHKIIRT
jgi:hypothetical protein